MSDIYRLSLTENPDGEVVARVEGEIDMATAPAVGSKVAKSIDEGPVVLDMTRVEFIDSAGIRMMVEMARRAEDRGHKLRLVAPRGCIVHRMVELTGIERLFVMSPGAAASAP